MIGIYKIISPSGKIYIGQSINIEKRFKQYEKLNCIKQVKLYNSFLKYGVCNHLFHIVEECLVEELNEKETYWGIFYNVLNKGLNHKLGNTKHSLSDTTLTKMKESAIKRGRTSEMNDKLSVSLKKYYSKNKGSFSGKRHTDETKDKISKRIGSYKDGELVKEYSSLKEAGLDHKTHSGNIIKSMKRNGKLHGLEWKYL